MLIASTIFVGMVGAYLSVVRDAKNSIPNPPLKKVLGSFIGISVLLIIAIGWVYVTNQDIALTPTLHRTFGIGVLGGLMALSSMWWKFFLLILVNLHKREWRLNAE